MKTAFASLLQSKKCSSDNVNVRDFLCEKTPNDLSLFQFKYAPPVLLVNDFFFCLFTNVVLVFDKNGIFSTAIDPTAISVTLDKLTEHVLISNGSVVRQEFTDVDSKLIQQGITRTTCTYTRNDGLTDRRYSYNPRIEYRSDDYEYGIIGLSIINFTISFKVSSKTAITRFGSFSEKYIRKCNDLHNPIPDFLLLLKYLSDDDHSSINNIIETVNSSTLNKNYFCLQTNKDTLKTLLNSQRYLQVTALLKQTLRAEIKTRELPISFAKLFRRTKKLRLSLWILLLVILLHLTIWSRAKWIALLYFCRLLLMQRM